MSDKQRAAMKITDMILEIVDASYDTPRSDIEGMAMATATEIITAVIKAQEMQR